MKSHSEKCHQCGHILPPHIVLQAYPLDGRLVWFHLNCFEPWLDKEIPVLRVEHDGNSFVTQEPYTPEPGEEVTLHWETMKQGKFNALKEFTGF